MIKEAEEKAQQEEVEKAHRLDNKRARKPRKNPKYFQNNATEPQGLPSREGKETVETQDTRTTPTDKEELEDPKDNET